MAKEVGSIYYRLDLKTGQFDREMATASAKAKSFGQATGASFTKLANVGKVALGVGVAGSLALVASNIGNAVKRVDTLKNAPKVLQNLGFSAEEASTSFKKLEQGVKGLPTSLDNITTSLTAITSASGKSLAYSTDLTIAFNNMALAGGKGPQEAQRAMVQFTQALGRGKMGMQEFNTLAEVMPAQLGQVAKSLLGSEANISSLREALGDGSLTMDQFSDAIINLNANGGDGFASFATQAKDATSGIGTAWENMQAAITRGITKVMDSLGSENIANAIEKIGKAFEKGLEKVGQAIEWVADKEYVLAALAGVIGGVLVASIYSLVAASWKLMASPLGIIVAILGALGVVAMLVYKNWNKFIPLINKAKQGWNNLKSALQPVVDIFKAYVLPLLKQIGEFVKNQFIAAWNDLKNAFASLKQTLQPFMPLLKILGVIIGVAFVAPILLAVAAVLTFVAALVSIGVIIARAIGWLAKVGAAIDKFKVGLAKLVANTLKAIPAYEKLEKVFGKITNTAKNIVSSFIDATRANNNVTTAVNKHKKAQEDLASATDKANAAIDEQKQSAFELEGSQLSLERAQINYNDAVAQYGPNSLEAREAAHSLKEAQNRVAEAQKAATESANAAKQAQEELKNKQNEAKTSADNLGQAQQEAQDKTSKWEATKNSVNTFFEDMKTKINQVVESTKTKWNEFKNVASQKLQETKNRISQWRSSIGNFFSSAGSWLVGAGRNVVAGLGRGISNMGGAVWNAIARVSANIGNFFGGAWNWLYDVGQTIIQGLINGISSKIGEVRNKLSELTNMLPEWKGPPEKDRKLLVKSGQLIMQGFNSGISSEVGNIEKNLNSITGRIGGTVVTPRNTTQPHNSNNSMSHYGDIIINDRQDAQAIMNILGRKQELSNLGLAR